MKGIATLRVPEWIKEDVLDHYVNDRIATFPKKWGSHWPNMGKIDRVERLSDRHYILHFSTARTYELPQVLEAEFEKAKKEHLAKTKPAPSTPKVTEEDREKGKLRPSTTKTKTKTK